jgi:endonuclease-3
VGEAEMTAKQRMAEIILRLKENVRSDCALEYEGDPWRLAVMARLSAQCTDARVNIVCRELFAKFPTAGAMAEGNIAEIEELVRPCGLFRTKAKNIKEMSEIIVSRFSGEIPSDMDELLALPGVGRKIANLIRGDLYGLGGIVADTHCIRICGRLGFYPESEKDPTKVEKILTPLVPTEEQTDLCHRLVWFGRDVCTARSPQCNKCVLKDICKKAKKAGIE